MPSSLSCWPLLVGALAGAGCGPGSPPAGPLQRVILITCDTLRADRLGVYAKGRDTSPRLDEFAEECVVFDRAYAAAPLTIPALSSLMTGLLPDDLGMTSNAVLTPTAADTIAEVVSRAGVATAAVVSNWVLRERSGKNPAGLQQGFEHYDSTMEDAEKNRDHFKERLATSTTLAAIDWLRSRSGDRFFLWVHYQDPHGPYTPPEEFLSVEPVPTDGIEERVLEVGCNNRSAGAIPKYQVLGAERRSGAYRARYDGEVRFFDHEVGRLIDALRAEGLLEEALVIFTSDHGESLGEHDWWFTHGQTLYDELVRVPLLIRFPEGVPRPPTSREKGYERSPLLVGHVDVFPTVLSAFEITSNETRGKSLMTEALGPPRLMAQSVQTKGTLGRWESLTDGRWRLVRNEQTTMLFDLAVDPGERLDLAAEHPDRITRLEEAFRAGRNGRAALASQAEEEKLDSEELEQMRALGYAGDGESIPRE